ncbi:unnamed protein product [Cunninghamella echinulata]
MHAYTYSLLDEGSTFKRRTVRLVIFLLTFIILGGIIAPTYIKYSNSQDINNKIVEIAANFSSTPSTTIGNSPGQYTGSDGVVRTNAEVYFRIILSAIDPIKETANIRIDMDPPLDNGMSYFAMLPPNSYSFYFNGKTTTVNGTDPSTEWNFPINVYGDPGRYPFDYYQEILHFGFFPNHTLTNGITTHISAYGAQTGWDVAFNIRTDTNGYFTLETSITRNYVTKGFSLFVMILSWVLSLCQFFICAQALVRNREMIPQIIALPATLLFALPSLRNVQPGIPPIGIFLDMAGFFWNMALVAISLLICCLMFIFQYEAGKTI